MVSNTDDCTRRSALGTIAATLAGVAGIASAAGTASADGRRDRRATGAATADGPPRADRPDARTGRYEWQGGTVDRIVDGEHVVVLLEANGRVAEQVVVDHSAFPAVEEGDSVLVLRDGDDVVTIVRI